MLRCDHCGSEIRTKRSTLSTLTKCQRKVLEFLVVYIARNAYAPSFAEIASALGYKSLASVHEHLVSLERKGVIRRNYNESRSIEIVDAGTPSTPGTGGAS